MIESLTHDQKIYTEKKTLYEMRKDFESRTNIKLDTIAALCNVTERSIRNWESAVSTPNIVNIHDLLIIYGFDKEQLDMSPFFKQVKKNNLKKATAENNIQTIMRAIQDSRNAMNLSETT